MRICVLETDNVQSVTFDGLTIWCWSTDSKVDHRLSLFGVELASGGLTSWNFADLGRKIRRLVLRANVHNRNLFIELNLRVFYESSARDQHSAGCRSIHTYPEEFEDTDVAVFLIPPKFDLS